MKLIYLASPYTHRDTVVMTRRFEAACLAAGRLMEDGLHVFSPIAHSHPIAVRCELPCDFEYWRQYDELMLSRCDRLIVLMLAGWEQSRGVAAEIELAKGLGLDVEYMAAV